MSLLWELVEARGESSSTIRGGNSLICVHVVAARYEPKYINAWDRLTILRYFCIHHFRDFFGCPEFWVSGCMCLCSCCVNVLVFMLQNVCIHVVYVRLCSCCVRVPVFMLCTCACVHVLYVCLCSCCVCAVLFMLHVCALVFMLCTRACVHVVYVCLCSCCVRVFVFMLWCACVHVAVWVRDSLIFMN